MPQLNYECKQTTELNNVESLSALISEQFLLPALGFGSMEVVEKQAPINDENNRRKAGYFIVDNLSLFYYRYIFRFLSQRNVLDEDLFYAAAVNWAAENKIVDGYSSTEFGPDDAITREQMVAILCRYAAFKGADVRAEADLSGFNDSNMISPYALPAMKWAVANGIIHGREDKTLDPTGHATRVEFAQVIMGFCER